MTAGVVLLSAVFGVMSVGLGTAEASHSRFLTSIKIVVDIKHSPMPVRLAVDVERVLAWKHGVPQKLTVVPVKTYLVKHAGQQTLVVPVTNAVRRASYAPAGSDRLNGQIQLDTNAYHAPQLSHWEESDWVLRKQPPVRFLVTPFRLWRWFRVSSLAWQSLS